MLKNKESLVLSHIQKFMRGDESYFDKIALLIMPDIVNIAYRYTQNSEDAKDVCQEVLIKVYSKIKSFKQGAKFSTWVYRVTINASIDFLRKRKKTVVLNDDIAKDKTNFFESAHNIEAKDIEEKIKTEVNKLPMRQKNVFILKHFQGLKISEISKTLGCSQSSVKTHLVRSVANLRKNIGGLK